MCWNANVSINTFIIGVTAAVLALANKTYPWYFVLFLMSFVSMQLIEYFIWTYYNNAKLNKAFSVVVWILLVLQPVAAILLLYDKDRRLMKYLLFSYILLAVPTLLYTIMTDKNPFEINKSFKGENGHLIWGFLVNDYVLIIIIYMVFLFLALYLSGYRWLFILLLVTLLFSLYFYVKYRTWGTIWCWTANIASLIIIGKVLFDNIPFCKI
jgi:hypothetical protein